MGVETFLMLSLLGLRHFSRTLPTGFLNFEISFIDFSDTINFFFVENKSIN